MDDRAGPAIAVAFGAGLCGAVQPKLNAVLASRVDSALVASAVNFAVALVCVTVALTARPATRRQLRQVRTWNVPRWMLTAGVGGAVVVLAGAVTVETIGVATFSVAFFAGQIVFGLAVDWLGLAPGGKRTLTARRLAAMVLAIAAVLCAQGGREPGEFVPLHVAFVIASGAGVAFQSAFNARISRATGDVVAATALNVMVGSTTLAAILAITAVAGAEPIGPWPSEPWLYLGGAPGVTVVLSLAVATAALGVFATTIAMLTAQLTGAFTIDWLIEHEPPTPGVLAGTALIAIAVTLSAQARAGVAKNPAS